MPTNRHRTLSAIDEPVVLIDQNRMIIFANEAAKAALGVDIENTQLVRSLRHPDAMKSVNEVLEGAERSVAEFHIDTPHRTAFQLTVVKLKGDEAAALILRDVSPLLEAEQMRSDFVANVSHELRSPLTTLSGLIETLQGPAKDDEKARSRFLETMQREAGRMDRLIDDLLSLSRVEAQERVRPTTSVDLQAIVSNVIDTLKDRGDLDGHEIVFTPTKEPTMVAADADQLVQVFQNLIENAAKYANADGRISISIECRAKALGFAQSVVVATVSDEGEGIAVEHVSRLTERFYRVDSGRSRQQGGTELGLAIVKHIVSRHRGRLVVSSVEGKGSKFSVLLPVLTIPSE